MKAPIVPQTPAKGAVMPPAMQAAAAPAVAAARAKHSAMPLVRSSVLPVERLNSSQHCVTTFFTALEVRPT